MKNMYIYVGVCVCVYTAKINFAKINTTKINFVKWNVKWHGISIFLFCETEGDNHSRKNKPGLPCMSTFLMK